MARFTAGRDDPIAAIATPPGRGGVGIVRVSGRCLAEILKALHPGPVAPRAAVRCDFRDGDQQLLDQGLLLFFPGPHSFTGEDVIELHGHGGPVVMDSLLQRVLELGARLAQPGEFSQRAFLNDKIDLTQAEAIADLIDASSRQAARSAVRSLQGEFSQRIHTLVDALINLRVYVEAAMDFPEEEIDFLGDGRILAMLEDLIAQLDAVFATAQQGVILREGMTVVIAGKPNAGKSSLLNALSGRDSAIVTDIPGTTRDVLRESIHIDGMPLHVVDTAGLRDSADTVEQEGIRRAWLEIDKADQVLFIIDGSQSLDVQVEDQWPEFFARYPGRKDVALVFNKMDCVARPPDSSFVDTPRLYLSAKTGQGLDQLRGYLKKCMGYEAVSEGNFLARRRHLTVLGQALDTLQGARRELVDRGAGELLAEDLRIAQQLLGEITGDFTPDDLLGKIFSSFCIGK